MPASRRPSQKRVSQNQTVPISFRLDIEYRQRLEQQAQPLGLSPGELARQLVIDWLEDTERQRLLEEITSARQEVEELRGEIQASRRNIELTRRNLTKATTMILTLCGDRERATPDRIQAWVKANLIDEV